MSPARFRCAKMLFLIVLFAVDGEFFILYHIEGWETGPECVESAENNEASAGRLIDLLVGSFLSVALLRMRPPAAM